MSNLAFMRDGDNEIAIVATYTDELPAFLIRAKRWFQGEDKFKSVSEGFRLAKS